MEKAIANYYCTFRYCDANKNSFQDNISEKLNFNNKIYSSNCLNLCNKVITNEA